MAAKRKVIRNEEAVEPSPKVKGEIDLGKRDEAKQEDEIFGEKLTPEEEKTLDRILMVIVVFILAWLGLSILLVLRGYLCKEWVRGAFFCAGIS